MNQIFSIVIFLAITAVRCYRMPKESSKQIPEIVQQRIGKQ